MSRIIDRKSYELITRELAQCRLESRDSRVVPVVDRGYSRFNLHERYHSISPAYTRIYGRSIEDAYRNADVFLETVPPDELN